MKNLYTILYTMHDFNCNDEEVVSINDLLDKKSKNNTAVSELLEGVKFSPSKKVVDNVLDYLYKKH